MGSFDVTGTSYANFYDHVTPPVLVVGLGVGLGTVNIIPFPVGGAVVGTVNNNPL